MKKNKDLQNDVYFAIANFLFLISLCWHPKSAIGEDINAIMYLVMIVFFILDIVETIKRRKHRKRDN